MFPHEISELKIGDMVGVAEDSGSWGQLRIKGVYKVIKRNGHRHITLEGLNAIFDKNGKQRGDRYGMYLVRADMAQSVLAARKLRNTRTAAALEIDELLKGLRNGRGEIASPLSSETEEKIKQLLTTMRQ